MTIFNLYIFDRNGTCAFYRQWKREKPSGMSQNEEFKLMYGMLLSLRSFSGKLSPKDSNKSAFRSFQTSAYTLNYYETPTGVKFVMNTDKNATQSVRDLLRQIHSQIYVETVVKNPQVSPGQPIESDLFRNRLDDLVQKHASFQ